MRRELYSLSAYVFNGYPKNPVRTVKRCRDADGRLHLVEVRDASAARRAAPVVAVVGLPASHWGEAAHAAVVLGPSRQATELKLLDWCRKRMAGIKRPRQVHFVPDADLLAYRDRKYPALAIGRTDGGEPIEATRG